MFIRSERLFLRPCWPEDRSELLALAGAQSAQLAALAGWPAGGEGSRAHEPEDRRCPRFLVTLPGAQGSRLVGFVGLGRAGGQVEAGLWIAPAFRNRGYAYEAGRALLTVARTLGLRQIVAGSEEDDASAPRLLEKLGFRPRGGVLVCELGDPCGGGDAPDACMAA